MATSSVANLFSFFTPSKPPSPPPAPALKFPPLHQSGAPPTSSPNTHTGWAPLVLSNEAQSPHSCSTDVAAVVCPSLAHANTMFFRSGYNVQVIVDDKEPEERLLGRFRREVMRAGVIQECKRRRFFETKQDEKKRKTREAAKRNRRRFISLSLAHTHTGTRLLSALCILLCFILSYVTAIRQGLDVDRLSVLNFKGESIRIELIRNFTFLAEKCYSAAAFDGRVTSNKIEIIYV